ncbi:Ras-related protein Rab-40C [Liparis tanakae]|uniref:Ras-related protein Rab-40C n=1 Tax=Liparis tanakae TaxID=230148 RepID=A0A4Z2F713_9TELE|nr:Ras-related protein Rab-40C [Liparis tanakae]
MGDAMVSQGSPVKSYDYLLKFLLVGDSDVGKGEILDSLQDGSAESPYAYSSADGAVPSPRIPRWVQQLRSPARYCPGPTAAKVTSELELTMEFRIWFSFGPVASTTRDIGRRVVALSRAF